MPVQFEVVTNSCEIVSQVLDVGIASYVAERAVNLDFQYVCAETTEPSLTAWQIFQAIYVIALVPAFVGWIVLYLKGERADKFLKWGVLAFAMPVAGPLFALIPVDDRTGFIWILPVNRRAPRQGGRHADDAY